MDGYCKYVAGEIKRIPNLIVRRRLASAKAVVFNQINTEFNVRGFFHSCGFTPQEVDELSSSHLSNTQETPSHGRSPKEPRPGVQARSRARRKG